MSGWNIKDIANDPHAHAHVHDAERIPPTATIVGRVKGDTVDRPSLKRLVMAEIDMDEEQLHLYPVPFDYQFQHWQPNYQSV